MRSKCMRNYITLNNPWRKKLEKWLSELIVVGRIQNRTNFRIFFLRLTQLKWLVLPKHSVNLVT